MTKQPKPAGYAKTKFALSRQLEISRTTLDKFLAMRDAPQAVPGRGFDVAAVAAFVAANASNSRTLQSVDPTIRSLKAYELSLRCAKLRFHVEKERGAYVLRADVVASVAAAGWGLPRVLEQKVEREMPSQIAGLDIPGARVLGARLVDEILAGWQAVSEKWNVRDGNEVEPLPDAPNDL